VWPLAIRQGEDGAKQLEKTVLKLRQDQKGEVRKDWDILSWPKKNTVFTMLQNILKTFCAWWVSNIVMEPHGNGP
jgi:hypothetical protein